MGHRVSATRIPNLLERMQFCRQVRKTKEGGYHPYRDAQFEHINAQTLAFHAEVEPVISVAPCHSRRPIRKLDVGLSTPVAMMRLARANASPHERAFP
jgi:Rhodopirellula transposase DDE domain